MSDYQLLLKKELKGMFSVRGKFNKHTDFLGILISIILTTAIIVIAVLVYSEFLGTYTEVATNDEYKTILEMGLTSIKQLRLREVMTATYMVIILINVLAGVKKINRDILEGRDFVVLVRLPIKPEAIFLSKLTALFISQILVTSVTLIPLTITAGIVVKQAAGFWLRSVLMVVILPMLSLLLAAVISLVVHYVLRFLRSHFVLQTVVFILLLAAGFILYSNVLEVLGGMLVGDKRDQFFSTTTMEFFKQLFNVLYPANLCANFTIGYKPGLNLLFIILVAGCALTLSCFIVIKILNKVMKAGMEGVSKNTYNRNSKIKKHSSVGNLMTKEFINVLRTPSYAFQFFATAIVMPLMVYCLLDNFSIFMVKLVGNIEINFELSITIIMMLSVLTNTFCASNISRDGSMFTMEKTMPISSKQFVFSKIIFCTIVSLLSILVSCVIALTTGFINFGEMLIVFLVTGIVSVSMICFATRMDLNKPKFANNENNEVKDSSQTVSSVILIGIIVSGIISGIILVLGIMQAPEFRSLLANKINLEMIKTISICFMIVAISGIFGFSLVYLLKGITKRFYQTVD